MEVVKNRLKGEKVQRFRRGRAMGAIVPDSVIIHYTAGPSGDATVRMFGNKNSKFSAHIIVHEDGRVTQMVDFNRKAVHAGKSSYNGRRSYNSFSIGIEISNPGFLTKNPKGEGYIPWWEARKSSPKSVDPEMVVEGKHRNYPTIRMTKWHKYPQEQIDAVYKICDALCKAYNIKEILGHEEIAPTRKADPGPAFPLDDLRKVSFKNNPIPKAVEVVNESDGKYMKGTVTVKLNIRSAPKAGAMKVTKPMPKGTVVSILKESGDWFKLQYEIEGWVSRNYVEEDNSDDYGDGIISANKLNIREEPVAGSTKVTVALLKGTRVEIFGQTAEWFHVHTRIYGWAAKKYISPIDNGDHTGTDGGTTS